MKRRSEILKEVYDHLRNHFGIHTQGQFADAIGYSRPVISSALNGNDENVSDKMLRAITNKFPDVFNIDYLLKCEGQLLTTEEHVAKVASDDRDETIKPKKPVMVVEMPDELQTLLDRALQVSRRNEDMVERLVSAASQNRQMEISIENAAKSLRETRQHTDAVRADILTVAEGINKFREVVDTIREENAALKASNDALGKRLNKAAELFQQLNNQVAQLIEQQHRYPNIELPTHTANEPLSDVTSGRK